MEGGGGVKWKLFELSIKKNKHSKQNYWNEKSRVFNLDSWVKLDGNIKTT